MNGANLFENVPGVSLIVCMCVMEVERMSIYNGPSSAGRPYHRQQLQIDGTTDRVQEGERRGGTRAPFKVMIQSSGLRSGSLGSFFIFIYQKKKKKQNRT